MKKLLITIIVLINTLNALEITDSREFSLSLTPTHLQTSFSIKLLNKDISYVQKSLANTYKNITSVNQLCKGGSYHITPRYKYKKNEREFEGYEGMSNYNCNFKDIQQFNKVINTLDQNKLVITLNPIQWEISQKVKEEQLKLLKIRALTYSKNFAKSLDKTCKVSNIDFNRVNTTYQPQRVQMMYESKMQMDSYKPTKENIQIKLYVGFKYICK